MRQSGKPRWSGIVFLGFSAAALLAAQVRVPMSHGVRSILLVFWALIVYGLLGLITGARHEDRGGSTASKRTGAPRESLRIESPVEKVDGEIRPRTYGTAVDGAGDRKDEETEVH